MKRALLMSFGLVAVAVPVEAQLFNFPVYATPSGAPATFVSADYGRGLNEDSGEFDAFGGAVGRTGIGGRTTIVGGFGYVDLPEEGKWTFGGDVGVDMLQPEGSAQVTIQGGIGYISFADDVSAMHFPIGVAIKGNMTGPSADVMPWIMPRLSIVRTSIFDESETETDFGVSGGVGFTLPSGFGAHTAIDLLNSDESLWTLGVGVHYVIP
jgi:hypothetical protein